MNKKMIFHFSKLTDKPLNPLQNLLIFNPKKIKQQQLLLLKKRIYYNCI